MIAKFPHIRDYKAFRVPSTVYAKSIVKCQLAVATFCCDFFVPCFLFLRDFVGWPKPRDYCEYVHRFNDQICV